MTCEYQCDDCKFARWETYHEMGVMQWEWQGCTKEDEVSDEELNGSVDCHLYQETEVD
ncbi:MAG: hypothetical protein KBT35_01375 [Firmicutes bacterium]|nr:hypothetical protein [Candidatus Colivicinus equi]